MTKSVILGLGPVGMATARLLERNGLSYRFLTRRSTRGESRKKQLEGEGIRFEALAERPAMAAWSGLVRGQVSFLDQPDTERGGLLFLAVPHTAYQEALDCLDPTHYESIVLLSPGLASGSAVSARVGHDRVLSMANFWGAAKYRDGIVSLKAIKKKVYAGSGDRALAEQVKELFDCCETNLNFLSSCLEAEFRNITLYVHPPLSLAPLSLGAALDLDPTPKYLYKLYPEGPIERRRMRLYARYVDEVMNIGSRLGVEPFNFLSFLHRDNYQVPSCFLENEEADGYPGLEVSQQGDLLFARYSGLLVDAYSQPDENGRYFDFSAVPVQKAKFTENGKVILPRLLEEDLFHLLLLREMSHRMELSCPGLEELWGDYRDLVLQLSPAKQSALSFVLRSLKERAVKIRSTLFQSQPHATGRSA